MCCRYYAEILVASFSHQIQSEYYGGKRSVYIEGIALEHLRAPTHIKTAGTTQARTCHAVFHSFLFNDRKQDSATTIAHSKHIIELLKQQNIMSNMVITI